MKRHSLTRCCFSLIAGGALVLALAAPSYASTTLGDTSGTLQSCGNNVNYLQAQTNGAPSYAATSPGVIVSWSYRAGADTPDLKLKVYHPTTNANSWFLRSESAKRLGGTSPGQVRANQTNTFTESPGIPIQAGDVLGMTGSGSASTMACFFTSSNNDRKRTCCASNNPPDTPVGQNSTFLGDEPMSKLDLSAVMEPDADGDLYGDESQDSCPTAASVHSGPCPAAELSIVKTASANPTVGNDLTYTLAVKNNHATVGAADVSVTDALPAGVTFVSSSAGQGSCAGTSTVTCSLGTLSPGQSTAVTIVVRPTAAGSLTNTGNVSSSNPDADTSNNSSTVTTTVAQAPGPGPGPGPGPTPVPSLSALVLEPPAFFAARSGPSVRAAATRGTIVTYANTQDSTTTFTIDRRARGIKKGKRCVAPPRKSPRKRPKPCVRHVRQGSFTHLDKAGRVRFRFTGRLGGKTLKPGRYRLRAVARNESGKSKTLAASFRVKTPR